MICMHMENVNMNYKVLIWGTGQLSKTLLSRGVNADIIGFVQSKVSADFFNGIKLYSPTRLPLDYDYILVATVYSDEIKRICISSNIDIKKVVFLYRGKTTDFVDSEVISEILSEANYTAYKSEYGIITNTFFEIDLKEYEKLNKRSNFKINYDNLWPIISDKYAAAGTVGNYFWQDLWAARLILSSGIKNHYDIGSRMDGFIAHLLAADIDVTMIDVREFPTEIEGLHTIVDDAKTLHQFEDNSINSLSALCSIEHFGLGRYGDPIDPEACFVCFDNIQRVLRKDGNLYISLPIGKERVEFNAHRVFYPATIIEYFDKLKLVEYSTTAQGIIEYNADIHKYDNDTHNGNYRYGLFHFRKM